MESPETNGSAAYSGEGLPFGALPYYGGKQRDTLNAWIRSFLPEKSGLTYIEPFAGMLSVLLARRPADTEIVNDADQNIVSFWRAIREEYDEFTRILGAMPYARVEFEKACEVIKDKEREYTTLERAVAAYVVLEQGLIHGLGRPSGWHRLRVRTGARPDYLGRLPHIRERMKDVALECGDAVEMVEHYRTEEKNLIYLDPPYGDDYVDNKGYAAQGFDKAKMVEVLKDAKAHVVISGTGDDWDCLGWDRQVRDVFKPRNPGSELVNPRRLEVVWHNREPAAPLLPF